MTELLKKERLIPVIVIKEAENTVPLLNTLIEGNFRFAEITFRTACAPEALKMAAAMSGITAGAGTVINAAQCEKAIDCGASFIVSPGISESVYEVCLKRGVFYLPGCATATEIMKAAEMGIDVVKFFPAEAMGGIKTLKALCAAFPKMSFVPTGGINPDNIRGYLDIPQVAACGASWIIKNTAEETASAVKLAAETIKEYRI